MKIVKFKNGKYAIRKLTIIGYRYLDIKNKDFWWSPLFAEKYCQTTLEDCENVINSLSDRGVVVK